MDEQQQPQAMPAMGGATILFVEDDQFLRDIAAGKLTDEGFSVVAAPDGEQAMARLGEMTPSLILLDLLLPNMSGFEVLEQVRANTATSKIPVVVFSNLGEPADLERAQKLGANEFMVKSNFTLEELIETIKRYL